MLLRSLRSIGTFALAALVALTAAYWITNEPAPRIRVQWRGEVTAEQQEALERKYLLWNGRDRMSGGSTAYDLIDTSRSNIKALVEDPAVADTGDIDRGSFVVDPDTDRGDESTWIAHRIPGLRNAGIRWTMILLLALLALGASGPEAATVLRGITATVRRTAEAWNAHRAAPHLSEDVFDRLDRRFASLPGSLTSGRVAAALLSKCVVTFLLVAAIGLPILETWASLLLAGGLIAVVFGRCRPGLWRLVTAAALVVAVVGVKGFLPRADIAEAHNAFLVINDGEALQEGLPPEIFEHWRGRLDALYPPGPDPPLEYSWRGTKAIPARLYAWSADAIWRPAKYSRQVDAIDFGTIGQFRAGFTSEMYPYNFWMGDLERDFMPFYVMYELTPASVGSQLMWTGQVFWEGERGEFEEIVHREASARTIQRADVGRRIYAVSFPSREGFSFLLVPALKLRLGAWADALMVMIGVFGTLLLTIRPRWGATLRALVLFAAGYLVMTSLAAPESGRLGANYRPHGGGNDGLFHEHGGREMARLLAGGDIVLALQGTEAVYWFTPGTRYVRMVEKIIFGDTNHLFALVLAATVIVVFFLMRRFVGALPAWIITGLVCVIPVGNPSLLQYVTNARGGYGDAIGAGLFLLGLVLMLYNLPAAPSRHMGLVWAAGAALAASMFIRPNFALAVAWLGCVYAGVAWTRRDRRLIVTVGAGLCLALWMPFHNWYYGGEFFLISRSGASISVSLGPRDYLAAAADVLQGSTATPAVTQTSAQLAGWLWGPIFVYEESWQPLMRAVNVVNLLSLVVCAWIMWRAIRRPRTADLELTFLAGAALWAHVPMLFIFSTYYRFSMLAWDLSMMVLLTWLLKPHRVALEAQPRAPELRTASAS